MRRRRLRQAPPKRSKTRRQQSVLLAPHLPRPRDLKASLASAWARFPFLSCALRQLPLQRRYLATTAAREKLPAPETLSFVWLAPRPSTQSQHPHRPRLAPSLSCARRCRQTSRKSPILLDALRD